MKAHEKRINRERQIYKPPVLVVYGKVSQLTQAANSGSDEGSGGPQPNMAKMSERTVKQNIVRIGVHPCGVGLYLFDYKPEYRRKWGFDRQFGVMADEVEGVLPEAVSLDPDGYKVVDYGMLGIKHYTH